MLKNKLFAGAIFALALFVAGSVSAAYTFPNKIDTLQEKKDVQTVLNMVVTPSPMLTVDGVMGAKSIAAVKAFQTMKGLTADGLIGPMTRAALEAAQAGAPVATAGCPAGALFNATTGAPCTTVTTTLPAGCVAGAMFSSTTGASCATGVVATTTTGGATEGYLVLQSAPVAVVASANQSDIGDNVMAFGVKAKNSDIKIQRVNVHLTSVSGSNNAVSVSALPWKYITNLSLYNDGTLLATLPVTSTSLTENTFGTDYTAMFDGLNVNIAKESIANFIVKADVVGTIPAVTSPATVYKFAIDQSNAVRGVDGIGLSQYVSDVSTYSRVINFGTAGTGKITVVADGSNPQAMNVVTSLTNTTTGITGLVFDVQNTTNLAVNLKTITATLASANTYVSGYYLYDGGTMIASLGNPGGTTLTFTNLPSTFSVAANSVKVLTIKYDVSMNPSGSQTVSVANTGIVAVDANSNLLTVGNGNLVGSATGLAQTFQGSGAIVNLVSATAAATPTTTGATGFATGTFVFKVKANGVNLAKLSIDPSYIAAAVTANGSATGVTYTYTVSPDTTVSDGSEVTVTLTAVKTTASAGFVRFEIGNGTGTGIVFANSTNVAGAVTSGQTVSVTTGFTNFYTNSVYAN